LAKITCDYAEKGHSNLMLNMPLGYPAPELNCCCVTPLGPFPLGWMEEARESETER